RRRSPAPRSPTSHSSSTSVKMRSPSPQALRAARSFKRTSEAERAQLPISSRPADKERLGGAFSSRISCYPPNVAEGVLNAGGAFLVGLVFGDGNRCCAGRQRAGVSGVDVLDVHIDRGGRSVGMGWVADFHRDHRIADLRLHVGALTNREMFKFHRAEGPLDQFEHIQAAV